VFSTAYFTRVTGEKMENRSELRQSAYPGVCFSSPVKNPPPQTRTSKTRGFRIFVFFYQWYRWTWSVFSTSIPEVVLNIAGP